MKKLKYIGCAVLTAMICFGFTISTGATVSLSGGTLTLVGETSTTNTYRVSDTATLHSHPYGQACYTYDITTTTSAANFIGPLRFDGVYCSYGYNAYNGTTGEYTSSCYGGGSGYYSLRSATKYAYYYAPTGKSLVEIILKNCNTNGSSYAAYSSFSSSCKTTIDGGNYRGNPAFSSMRVVINKGTVIDYNNNSSSFTLGEDSEATSTTNGSTTITTVKLSNPPPPVLQFSAVRVLILIVGFLI